MELTIENIIREIYNPEQCGIIGINENFQSIKEKVKEIIRKIIDTIKNLFDKFMGSFSNKKTKADEMVKNKTEIISKFESKEDELKTAHSKSGEKDVYSDIEKLGDDNESNYTAKNIKLDYVGQRAILAYNFTYKDIHINTSTSTLNRLISNINYIMDIYTSKEISNEEEVISKLNNIIESVGEDKFNFSVDTQKKILPEICNFPIVISNNRYKNAIASSSIRAFSYKDYNLSTELVIQTVVKIDSELVKESFNVLSDVPKKLDNVRNEQNKFLREMKNISNDLNKLSENLFVDGPDKDHANIHKLLDDALFCMIYQIRSYTEMCNQIFLNYLQILGRQEDQALEIVEIAKQISNHND